MTFDDEAFDHGKRMRVALARYEIPVTKSWLTLSKVTWTRYLLTESASHVSSVWLNF